MATSGSGPSRPLSSRAALAPCTSERAIRAWERPCGKGKPFSLLCTLAISGKRDLEVVPLPSCSAKGVASYVRRALSLR
jgi:hypothetical protein